MVDHKQTEHTESLGEFLLRHRKEKKLTTEDIVTETRIPIKTLQAMEANQFEDLPAEAFARGFYSLLAKHLELDTEEILERFTNERGNKSLTQQSSPPLTQGKQVNTMAAKPSILAPGPFMGLTLVLLALTVAGLCWHFSWNPATFLSEKLRNLQKPSVTETLQQSEGENGTNIPPGTKYLLSVDFLDNTTAIVSIDNNVPKNEIFSKGSSHSWHAQEAVTLILPESAKVVLFLNGSQMDIPAPEGGFITLNLP